MDASETPGPKLESDQQINTGEQQYPSERQQHVELPSGLVRWLKVVPVFAVLISLVSLGVSIQSCRFAMGYARPNEDHDVVAKVLGVRTVMKGYPSATNAAICVDLAVINRGNQKEIIRSVQIFYSETHDLEKLMANHLVQFVDALMDRGEKRVFHVEDPFGAFNTGKKLWLAVQVRAIAPNGEDIQVTWPACQIQLAPDGGTSMISYDAIQIPLVHVIAANRQPNQRPVPLGM